MQTLHVSQELLGANIINDRNGGRRRILAVWLEKQERDGLRPILVALTVDVHDGSCFKVNLPDIDWSFVK